MKSPIGPVTPADQARFDAMQCGGCLACRQLGRFGEPSDVHHLLSGGYRIGHQFTVALCPWHHRGVRPKWALNDDVARAELGPSMKIEPSAFRIQFGFDHELLATQNRIIDLHRSAA